MRRCAFALAAVLLTATLWHGSATRIVGGSPDRTAGTFADSMFRERRLQQDDEQPGGGFALQAAGRDDFGGALAETEDGEGDAAAGDAAADGRGDGGEGVTVSDSAAGGAVAGTAADFPSVVPQGGGNGVGAGAEAGTAGWDAAAEETPAAGGSADGETAPDVEERRPVDDELAERQKVRLSGVKLHVNAAR